jgi:hypothetical protein
VPRLPSEHHQRREQRLGLGKDDGGTAEGPIGTGSSSHNSSHRFSARVDLAKMFQRRLAGSHSTLARGEQAANQQPLRATSSDGPASARLNSSDSTSSSRLLEFHLPSPSHSPLFSSDLSIDLVNPVVDVVRIIDVPEESPRFPGAHLMSRQDARVGSREPASVSADGPGDVAGAARAAPATTLSGRGLQRRRSFEPLDVHSDVSAWQDGAERQKVAGTHWTMVSLFSSSFSPLVEGQSIFFWRFPTTQGGLACQCTNCVDARLHTEPLAKPYSRHSYLSDWLSFSHRLFS